MRLLVTDLAQTVDLWAQFCWVAIVILSMLADEQHVCVQLTSLWFMGWVEMSHI